MDIPVSAERVLAQKYEALVPFMDERMRRYWAASEARQLGHGGIQLVSRVTSMSRTTITAGIAELAEMRRLGARAQEATGRVRRPGGGRRPLTTTNPALVKELDALVEPETRGDPMSPLRWTCKSLRRLSEELTKKGHPVSPPKVGELLAAAGYGLQGTRKTLEGKGHPDRDAQFRHINTRVKKFQRAGQPVVSVDTKKKELVGPFKNAGREWQPNGKPVAVRVHDFIDKKLGKAIPYGVYDLLKNEGWVSVGTDHDTPAFAVESLARWWREMGRLVYPDAKELLITADGGGSNGHRARAWKVGLQRLADETGLVLAVSHFPPGTSKWNKIEHRMFCHITRNWRGRPLTSVATVVSLIGNTTTTTGLRIKAKRDDNHYPTGVKISAEQLAQVNLRPSRFHGEWNYTVRPTALINADHRDALK